VASAGLSGWITAQWSVDKDLDGWEMCLSYHDGFASDWHVQSYPWAGNSEEASISPMRYCGVPGALVYRRDLSFVLLFAIDSRSDYLKRGGRPWPDALQFVQFVQQMQQLRLPLWWVDHWRRYR
jgi:hypothetical protein